MDKRVQDYVTVLLDVMGKRIPMHPAKPNLTISDGGILQLSVIVDGFWYNWIFDEEERFEDPEKLADFIIEGFREGGLNV